jgi:hypothetical protein
MRLVRHFKDHLDIAVPTARTLQAGYELIERECLATCPDQRLHVQLSTGAARDGGPLVATVRVVGSQQTADTHTPAKPPKQGRAARSACAVTPLVAYASLAEVRLYTKAVNQKRLAEAAMAKVKA